MNDISDLQYDEAIFGGDLNIELDNKGILCRHLDSFACDLQLTFVDDKISSKDKYTWWRVAQNKIPHRRICNIFANSGLILKILEAV